MSFCDLARIHEFAIKLLREIAKKFPPGKCTEKDKFGITGKTGLYQT